MPRAGSHSPRRMVLTPKQRQVLALMAKGRTNFEIARELGLSLEGAKYHVSEILARLDVYSREEAVAAWHEEQAPMRRIRRVFAPLAAGGWLGPAALGVVGAAAVAAGIVVVTVGRDNGSDEDEQVAPPAAPIAGSPTPTVTPRVGGVPPACGTATRGTSIIDWVPFVRVTGQTYLLHQPLPAVSAIGPIVETVKWNVSDDGVDPCHSALDGASSVLPPGTEVYELQGYNPAFRLVAETASGWRIFEADWRDGAANAGELLDVRGKVVTMTVDRRDQLSGDSMGYWTLADPARVQAVTARLLDQPIAFTPGSNDGPIPALGVTFALEDGTTVSRFWFAGPSAFSMGIPVDAAFLDEVVALIESD